MPIVRPTVNTIMAGKRVTEKRPALRRRENIPSIPTYALDGSGGSRSTNGISGVVALNNVSNGRRRCMRLFRD
ncbi:unnamed protein product [Macrosiphum euphorbiae]|uniref:Uncharacterized protein n=1 Tax=Macrosiphum euphorbiae TaxID=13131 RepID=A0AAV0X854_9HEMI|nr:unnamed protein product [Macrosiphum euphorbiae]